MIDIKPELLQIYAFWGGVLALKLFFMIPATAYHRFTKKVFMNPEDTPFTKGAKVSYNDSDVERVRRAHRNDLENILPWYIITLLWLTTGPATWMASLLIKTFVFVRIGHTFVYAIFPQQPLRAIFFFIGVGITIYQVLCTILYYS